MASWSQNRKTLYGGVTFLLIATAILLPAYKYFYVAPSCGDGKQNGDEKGVDCGGSCVKICASAFYAPNIAWTRLEQVAPGLYNVAAYIINPNPNATAIDVPYSVTVYDNNVTPIIIYSGKFTIPPHRNTLVFNGAVSTGKRIPVKALFQFTGAPDWVVKTDPLSAVNIGDKKYLEDANGSSLSVTVKNNSVNPVGKMSVYAVLYDKDSNALGFSKTVLDGINSYGTAIAPFTWPVSRDNKVISIEVLPVAE